MEDTLSPARRDEDKLARIMSRAADGLYSGQAASFTADAASVEIMLANGGRGPCGPADEFGRCSARYHDLECMHGQAADWLAAGPPRETYQAALANMADGMNLDLAPRMVWDDPDDEGQPMSRIPAATVELAHQLAVEWNLEGDAHPAPAGLGAYADLLRAPGAPVSVQDAMLADMGCDLPQEQRPSYPGVKELRERMGI